MTAPDVAAAVPGLHAAPPGGWCEEPHSSIEEQQRCDRRFEFEAHVAQALTLANDTVPEQR